MNTGMRRFLLCTSIAGRSGSDCRRATSRPGSVIARSTICSHPEARHESSFSMRSRARTSRPPGPFSQRNRRSCRDLAREDHGRLAVAIFFERFDTADLMLRLGFDPAAPGIDGGTALHAACWVGNVRMVEGVLARGGVPLDARDSTHKSTPLGWAAFGSVHRRARGADYPAVAERLVAAGADISAPRQWRRAERFCRWRRGIRRCRRRFGGWEQRKSTCGPKGRRSDGARVQSDGARVRSEGAMVLTQLLSSAFVSSSEVPLKTGYCADSAASERIERRPLHFIDVVAIPRIADVVTTLVQRPTGDVEEASELRIRSPSESFGDIGRRRRNGRSNLIAEVSIGLDVCSFD